jgi:hypothetical protein
MFILFSKEKMYRESFNHLENYIHGKFSERFIECLKRLFRKALEGYLKVFNTDALLSTTKSGVINVRTYVYKSFIQLEINHPETPLTFSEIMETSSAVDNVSFDVERVLYHLLKGLFLNIMNETMIKVFDGCSVFASSMREEDSRKEVTITYRIFIHEPHNVQTMSRVL